MIFQYILWFVLHAYVISTVNFLIECKISDQSRWWKNLTVDISTHSLFGMHVYIISIVDFLIYDWNHLVCVRINICEIDFI